MQANIGNLPGLSDDVRRRIGQNLNTSNARDILTKATNSIRARSVAPREAIPAPIESVDLTRSSSANSSPLDATVDDDKTTRSTARGGVNMSTIV